MKKSKLGLLLVTVFYFVTIIVKNMFENTSSSMTFGSILAYYIAALILILGVRTLIYHYVNSKYKLELNIVDVMTITIIMMIISFGLFGVVFHPYWSFVFNYAFVVSAHRLWSSRESRRLKIVLVTELVCQLLVMITIFLGLFLTTIFI